MQEDKHYNDEIDLRDLIKGLWQGKWLIIAVALATILVAVAYLKLAPQTYKASLPIQTLDSFTTTRYQPLNDTGLIEINQDTLAVQFFDRFLQVLPEALVSTGYLSPTQNETEQEFQIRVGAEAAKFEVTPPASSGQKNGKPYWQLTYTSIQPDSSRVVIEQAIGAANALLHSELQAHFASQLHYHEIETANKISDIDLIVSSLLTSYKAQMTTRVATLNEQAAIARELGLEGNQMVASMQSSKDVLLVNSTGMPLYLNGYVALEREIQLLQQRQYLENYIPELADLRAQQYALTNDPTAERAKALYQQTPLTGEDFAAVRIELAALSLQPKLNARLILILAIFLGGLLGTIILVVRNSLK